MAELRDNEDNDLLQKKVTSSVEEGAPFDFSCSYSDNIPGLLRGLKISLAVTSYQSQRLFLVRSDGESIDINFKRFRRPMGLASTENEIVLGTFDKITKFIRNDSVIAELEDKEKVDACFTPNASHTTGMINIHDIAYGDEGLWVVNSAFSCLATIEPDFSFVPKWKPGFITELVPEDRCHVNGMAMKDGKPKYVTTFNKLNESGVWKKEKKAEGTLIDIDTNEILLDNLAMPHSPRFHNGKIYLCESGLGTVYSLDPDTKEKKTVAKLQGFTRGMDFYGPLMFVGVSKVRVSDINNPIPVSMQFEETYSGVWIINLEDNSIVGNISFEGDVDQIYDISVLYNMTYPELIEPGHNFVKKIFNFPKGEL